MPSHRETIVDQFTRQAVPFSTAPVIRDEGLLALLVEAAEAGTEDVALDVACGPGLVVCALARAVRHATGLDVTPAMLERARTLARERRLENVAWVRGEVDRLPFPDATFSVVTSRFAFHHLTEPAAALAEMRRMCRPGGRVVLMDLAASPDPEKGAAFERMEKLRDPSHVRALALDEMVRLFAAVGLAAPRITPCRLALELEGVLARSFPAAGDVDRIRRIFVESLADDALGLEVRRHGDEIRFSYRVAILAAAVG
jgi:SAM-dependent methyltransferase